MAQNVIN